MEGKPDASGVTLMTSPQRVTHRDANFIERPSLDSSSIDEEKSFDGSSFSVDEDELPSFKNVVLTGKSALWSKNQSSSKTNSIEGEKFFDYRTKEFVEVDNFAFANGHNHFVDPSELEVQIPTGKQFPPLPLSSNQQVPDQNSDDSSSSKTLLKCKGQTTELSSDLDEESSLALLDPKLFSRLDSNDVFGINSADEDLVNIAFPQITSGEQRTRHSLVKQLSMCAVDHGGDGFRPQGASSPLPPTTEHQPMAIVDEAEADLSTNSLQTSLESAEANTSKPKILSPFERKNSSRRKSSESWSSSRHRSRKSSVEGNSRKSSVDGNRQKSVDESSRRTTPLRKLSNDLGSALPSRSGPSTPRSSDVSRETVESEEPTKQPQQKQQQQQQRAQSETAKTRIPKFIRNSTRSQSSGSSPVERKLKQQVDYTVSSAVGPGGHDLDRVAKKLGHKKSHSVSNLSKISVKDYHSSSGLHHEHKFLNSGAKKSSSFDGLERARSFSNTDLHQAGPVRPTAGHHQPVNKFAHVQSKVRKYIDGYSGPNRPASTNKYPLKPDVQAYDRSFQLSPGRKSLSMSNISGRSTTSSRRPSQSNLSRMKSFLSSHNLDGVQITISGARKSISRESLQSSQLNVSRISRLLDQLSDDDDVTGPAKLNEYHTDDVDGNNICLFAVSNSTAVCLEPGGPNISSEEEMVLDVEDLLQLAIEERKGKQEAKQVLCQLQENYDALQKRFAQAENIIDKMRFGNVSHLAINNDGFEDSAFVDQPLTQLSGRTGSSSIFGSLNHNNIIADEPVVRPTGKAIQAFSAEAAAAAEKLKEIHQQLYGLEILSSTTPNLTTLKKRKIVNQLRSSFEGVKSFLETMNSDRHLAQTLMSDDSFVRLLAEVGRKLSLMEQSSSCEEAMPPPPPPPTLPATKIIEPDVEDQRFISGHGAAQARMGPIEKVEKWREQQHQLSIEDVTKKSVTAVLSGGGSSNLPSCYGSCPTSPTTVSGSREALDQTDRLQRKSFDFDSGCPGSERSAINPIRKSPPMLSGCGSPFGGAKYSDRKHQLSYVDEREEKVVNVDTSTVSNAVSERQLLSTKSKNRLFVESIPADRLHREAYHSVTDLSSDERGDNVDKDVERSTKSSPLHRQQHLTLTPSSTHCVTPRGATAILASQIDQDILELRSFFEDHRDEMLSLLNGSSKDLLGVTSSTAKLMQSVDTQTPSKSPSKLLRSRDGLSTKFPVETESDSIELSLQEERRMEFRQRRLRQMQRRRGCDSSPSKVDSIDRSHRRSTDALVAPQFAIGSPASPLVAATSTSKSHAISSFFPHVSSSTDSKFHVDSRKHSMDVVDGRRVSANDGQDIFIPRLNLDELASEESENFCAKRDPRSFDFNQSLDQFEEDEEDNVQMNSSVGRLDPLIFSSASCTSSASRTRRRVSASADQGVQVNDSLLLTPSTGEALRRSVSVGQLKGDLSQRPIIIVQKCCGGHAATSRSCHNESARGSQFLNPADFAKVKPSVKSSAARKRCKQKDELRKLLESLSQANEMAAMLKERSAEMLDIIGQDMRQLTTHNNDNTHCNIAK